METREDGAPDPREDWLWLERTAEGDPVAFERLVSRHQDRVVRLCQRLLGERERALEAAQEVFLKLYRKAPTLERRGALYTWLYRVATNYCLNRLRRRRIVRFLPLAGGDDRSAWDWDFPDAAPGPERTLEARREWHRVRRAIAELPLGQRAVLVLARFEGLSYRQIAETLEITEGAVESRLFRAMRRLVKAQEEEQERVT